MDKGLKSTCAGCGKLIDDGENYASIGGNIVPYMPAKEYHLVCVPAVKPVADDREFVQCSVDGCPKEATYITPQTFVFYGGGGPQLLFYCEVHGQERGLSRGIPVNHAEPESRCNDCQAPLEAGTVCGDCALPQIPRVYPGILDFVPDLAQYRVPKIFSYTPQRFSIPWFKAHVDHFIISFMVGVPLLVANAFASNLFSHHSAQILYVLGIPAAVRHWMGY